MQLCDSKSMYLWLLWSLIEGHMLCFLLWSFVTKCLLINSKKWPRRWTLFGRIGQKKQYFQASFQHFLWRDHFAWTLSWFKIWFISFDCQLIILSQSTTFCTSYAGAKFPENWRNFQKNHEKIPRFSLFKFLGGLLFTGISLSARSLERVVLGDVINYVVWGPGRTGQILRKNLSPVPSDFVKAYQTSGTPSLASEQDKFLSGVKSDRFVNLHAMIWRTISIKKIWPLFLVGVFQSEARRNCFLVARQSNGKDGRFLPRYNA